MRGKRENLLGEDDGSSETEKERWKEGRREGVRKGGGDGEER